MKVVKRVYCWRKPTPSCSKFQSFACPSVDYDNVYCVLLVLSLASIDSLVCFIRREVSYTLFPTFSSVLVSPRILLWRFRRIIVLLIHSIPSLAKSVS